MYNLPFKKKKRTYNCLAKFSSMGMSACGCFNWKVRRPWGPPKIQDTPDFECADCDNGEIRRRKCPCACFHIHMGRSGDYYHQRLNFPVRVLWYSFYSSIVLYLVFPGFKANIVDIVAALKMKA